MFWEDLEKELEDVQFSIMHQHREVNQVEDFLVWLGEGGITKQFVVGENILPIMKGLIPLDKLGLQSIHKM